MGRKKKSKLGFSFVPLPRDLLRSEVWHRLSLPARCAYFLLESFYDGNLDGLVAMTSRQASNDLQVSKATASRALSELVAAGLLRLEKFPGKNGHGSRMAPVYRLRRVMDKKYFSTLCEWNSSLAGGTTASLSRDAKPKKTPKTGIRVSPKGREGQFSRDSRLTTDPFLDLSHTRQPNLGVSESEISTIGQPKFRGGREKIFPPPDALTEMMFSEVVWNSAQEAQA